MIPNKQKIYTSQPIKPGTSSKLSLSKSSVNTKSYSNNLPKYPVAKQPEFQLNDIIKNFKTKRAALPFKMIQFEDSKHLRKDTTIINDVQQSYKFVSALSYIETPLSSEEEPKETPIPIRRSLSEIIKDEELCNNTTDTFRHKPESLDLMYYGIIPTKY